MRYISPHNSRETKFIEETMLKKVLGNLLLTLILGGCATVSRSNAETGSNHSVFVPCPQDQARQKIRSEELQMIVNEDQKDRTPPIDWSKVSPRDEARRKRIGEIF